MRLPVYRLIIDHETEGMDFMGLVDTPAHGKKWATMAKAPKAIPVKQVFDGEKQVVTGVAIATDLMIYRRDSDGYEYNVYLTKADVFEIMKMFAKKGYHNNVNLMHDQNQKVKDAYLLESYFIWDNKKNIPEAFAGQNLQPGSLIFSYWIEGKKSWEFVKNNGTGFSLEGWFKELPVKFVNNKPKINNMNKKVGLMARLFGAAVVLATYDKKKKYAEAVNSDGDTIQWDGDLTVGETSVFVIPAEGDPVLAPEGDMTVDVDGVMWILSVDENGILSAMEEVTADDTEEMEQAMVAMKAHYEEKFSNQERDMRTMASAIDDLTEALEKLAEKKPAKTTPAKGDGGYASLRGK